MDDEEIAAIFKYPNRRGEEAEGKKEVAGTAKSI